MISNGEALCVTGRGEIECVQVLADVAGELGHALRFRDIGRISTEEVAVVLHDSAAAGDGDQDRVEAFAPDLAHKGIDQRTRLHTRLVLAPHMVHQGAAAAVVGSNYHLYPGAIEHTDGGLVRV